MEGLNYVHTKVWRRKRFSGTEAAREPPGRRWAVKDEED